MLAKAAGDPAELSCRLDDELVIDAGFVLENQIFNLVLECIYFLKVQAYFTLPFARPQEWAIERFRSEVGGEEGDGVESERSCGIDCLAQITVVRFLHGGSTCDRDAGIVKADRDDALADQIVSAANSADGVVNLRRAVKGDDDVIEEGGHLFCAFVKQETRGEQCEVNLPVTKEVAESGEVVME